MFDCVKNKRKLFKTEGSMKNSALLTNYCFNLRWLVGLKLVQFEQQKTQLPFLILAKILKPIFCRVVKGT